MEGRGGALLSNARAISSGPSLQYRNERSRLFAGALVLTRSIVNGFLLQYVRLSLNGCMHVALSFFKHLASFELL